MLLNRPLLARMASSLVSAAAGTGLVACLCSTAFAQDSNKKIGAVFYIELENHNWTQGSDTTAPNQIFGCVAAPYINSFVTPDNKNAKDVSYAIAYHNVLSTPTGDNPSIHPSEPNYLWQKPERTSAYSTTTIPMLPRAAVWLRSQRFWPLTQPIPVNI